MLGTAAAIRYPTRVIIAYMLNLVRWWPYE